jgi:hypothetical protein
MPTLSLFGDWIATKNGMLDTLLSMIQSGDRTSPLKTSPPPSSAFSPSRPQPEREANASRLLNLLMDGLRPPPRRIRPA